jgi:Helix-turn-helix domain
MIGELATAAPPVMLQLAYSKPQAAAVLGISVDSFDRYVGRDIKAVRRGKLRLYPRSELERWLRENACRPPGV